MDRFGKAKLEGKYNTLAIQNNGGVRPLTIAQPDMVPEDYLVTHVPINVSCLNYLNKITGLDLRGTTPEPWTKAIREALERGEGVPGCRLEERGRHLRVK
jgi:hypothetical protein